MFKKAITMGLCVIFLSMAATVFAEDVYKTKNGKKYHTADCRLIQNKSPQKITKEDAIAKGLVPCAKCFKDEVSANSSSQTKQVVSSKKTKSKIK